jgi:hypothetical protein
MSLDDAIAGLDEAVREFLALESKDVAGILSAAFALNNEIGRPLMLTRDPALKALQLRVNDVVVAAKKMDRASLPSAMKKVISDSLHIRGSR